MGTGKAVVRDLRGKRPANPVANPRAAAVLGAVGAGDEEVMAVVRVEEEGRFSSIWILAFRLKMESWMLWRAVITGSSVG